MTAIEKIPIAPHLAHFAQGYRLRASGNTPALTNSRMVKLQKNLEQTIAGHHSPPSATNPNKTAYRAGVLTGLAGRMYSAVRLCHDQAWIASTFVLTL
jgi:hypothetical protein